MGALDRVLADAVARGVAPGLVAGAVTAHGTMFLGAAGTRAIDDPRPMEPDSVFWIHSMTKAIAAACCMQAVEEGLLRLDDDLGALLPPLAAPRVLEGFDGAGAPILRPARGAITLRRLLTHTAGFAYEMWNETMRRYGEVVKTPRHLTFESAETCLPLAFDPGTSWAYGVGIDWAGKALEAASGSTLEAWMQTRLLEPLGMRDTGYRLRPEIAARMAGMHRRRADGGLDPISVTPMQDARYFMGGGGLFSTAADYLRFLRMLLGGGRAGAASLLRADTVAAMAQNHMGALSVLPMRTADPARTNDADFFPGMEKKWGLSFLINTQDVPGRRAAGSLAWAGLANTYFWIDPARGVAGVILAQLFPFADDAVLESFAAFERAVYATL